MREIVDGILTWSWFSEPHGYDFNGHLIRHPGGNVCVDPVEPSEDDLEALVGEGVSRILLTNRNHSRAANRIRARTGARTSIHADDADHARSQDTDIDDTLTVGDRIGPLEVIAAAGKSPGEVALLWPERGILIVGDAVIGQPPGRSAGFCRNASWMTRHAFAAVCAGSWSSTSKPCWSATASPYLGMPKRGCGS